MTDNLEKPDVSQWAHHEKTMKSHKGFCLAAAVERHKQQQVLEFV
jgi:hypothetical protein